MTMVPTHPESVVGEPSVLRWIIPAGLLPFVGPVTTAPVALQSSIDDGTIARIDVEPTAIRIRLSAGRSWRTEGDRIRRALHGALAVPDAWMPQVDASPDAILRMAVLEVIDGDVGDYIRSHGGIIELVGVSDGRVRLSLNGSCAHCPASDVTLTERVERAVRTRFPAVREVTAESDKGLAGGRRLLGIIPTRRAR
ncbi:NifU family protein [Rhodococcus sp. MALMAid1271]|uniref:NifU family protein n=1 Tax=Rhodococcus sp. MALMAid1271 TaxID=3411744 RepID=UPI003B9E2B6E